MKHIKKTLYVVGNIQVAAVFFTYFGRIGTALYYAFNLNITTGVLRNKNANEFSIKELINSLTQSSSLTFFSDKNEAIQFVVKKEADHTPPFHSIKVAPYPIFTVSTYPINKDGFKIETILNAQFPNGVVVPINQEVEKAFYFSLYSTRANTLICNKVNFRGNFNTLLPHKSIVEIKKNSQILSQSARTKTGLFQKLPTEINVKISALTGDPDHLNERESEKIAKDNYNYPKSFTAC